MKLPLSIKKSITFNCAMLFAGLLHYRCVTFAKIFPMDLMLINLTFITRNFAFVYVLNEYSRHKSPINENIIIHQSYPNEFNINVLTSSSVDAVTYYYIKNSFASSFIDFDVCNLWYFIILMFYFEIIFDFFHYWLHRLLHENRFLYRHIHKKHHKFAHPIPILTYYQEPLDLFLSNTIPTVLTLMFSPSMSLFEFNVILVCKTCVEVSGHAGRRLYPSHSFSNCVWLPRIFGIQLYTEDHDKHHSINNCNYGKRFSLWDRVFGTYVSTYDDNDM
jgi:sterol desaturase/sphingolipid hydroxylase (fatty acid hydroxylase superfamily)